MDVGQYTDEISFRTVYMVNPFAYSITLLDSFEDLGINFYRVSL
jgi:hypothetical protein